MNELLVGLRSHRTRST